MTVLEQVEDYIARKSPEAVCDDRIAAALGLSVRQHANYKTRGLALVPRFERAPGVCSVCGAAKKVIRCA